jgi:hypothetical protein
VSTLSLTVLFSLVVILVALSDWRRALLLLLAAGLLQDVFRKLTPDVPAYFTVWSMALYIGIAGIVILRGGLPPVNHLFLRDRYVQAAWAGFVLVVVFQLFNALLRWGNVAVPVLGGIFYLAPPLAVLVGFAFANGERAILRFMKTYMLIFVPAALSVYLSPLMQDGWPVLRDVGSFIGRELVIYDVGTVLKSYSGLLRVGEIAAWHAATAAAFLLTLVIQDRRLMRRVLFVILIIALIGAIVMTGRRKMLMTLSIFATAQWALLAYFRKGLGAASIALLLLGTVGSFAFVMLESSREPSLYLQRSSTVFGETVERAQLSLQLMRSAFDRSAGLGLGAGSASQGISHAGVDVSSAVGGSAESGLGKLMIELGVIGLLSGLFLVFAAARRLLKNMRRMAVESERLLLYQAAILALLFANLMTFTVATQVYGDYFILIVLGTLAGFAVRLDWVAHRLALQHSRSGHRRPAASTAMANSSRSRRDGGSITARR